MAYESSRRALRGAILPILGGFLLMIVSVGLWVVSAEIEVIGVASRIVGALGSGTLLLGALKLARANVDGRPSFWLMAFFGLWLGELVLRLWTMAGAADAPRLLAVRILLAACAMICLASGVLQIWKASTTWVATKWLFLLQVAAAAGLVVTGVPAPGDSILGQTFQAGAWLAFAAPYAHAVLSIRRTTRWLSGGETVADILTN